VTLKQVLYRARQILTENSIEDAALEGEILLRHVLAIDRAQLYSEPDRELSREQEADFWHLLQRRLSGEPSAYITGHREFYGLDFYIDRRVLIPRPETELLVAEAVRLVQTGNIAALADIGTGCGAIAVSLGRHFPRLKIYASDVSADALAVARINGIKHGVADRVQLLHGDMLAPLPEPVDLITANLPYVREQEITASGLADFEPRLALDGGADGLDKIRHLCQQGRDKLRPQGVILLEIGQGQAGNVTNLLRHHFPAASVAAITDFQGMERVIRLCLTLNSSSVKLVF